ncbi:serine/threonine protein kinase [Cladophialophora psammophila CBS 110553]|uniref:Serine/threonine protein kinase n=1 Tax=Cladophialophora psammophila CBS 110553 TaxID=1182543 RepID=W9XBM6_9EURO|nr:serine/threonine protein kinase [Cladophialophora psammophila CBS 110553]EXJ67829.1 serine/threonine protein kinase [Cladophialophora psammophila CBS 110553]
MLEISISTLGNKLRSINVYNEVGTSILADLRAAISRSNPDDELLGLGDFNLYHPLWSTTYRHANRGISAAQPLLIIIEDFHLQLRTVPGSITHWWKDGDSTIDLTFSSEEVASRSKYCKRTSVDEKYIVEYVGYSEQERGTRRIDMALKAGNVNDLLRMHPNLRSNGVVLDRLIKQMLEALENLAYQGLFHRDVKPDNILYTPVNRNECIFQLADLGLANEQAWAKTQAGAPIFQAPEICYGGYHQTSKVDVWSLFVTLVAVTRPEEFEDKRLNGYGQILDLVGKAAKSRLSSIDSRERLWSNEHQRSIIFTPTGKVPVPAVAHSKLKPKKKNSSEFPRANVNHVS